jgi:N,N'-diacetyllegionaminate synthase
MKLFGKDTDTDLIVVAEIGVNHEGDLEQAMKLCADSVNAGADACKIQVGDVSSGPERKGAGFNLAEEEIRELTDFCLNDGFPIFASALSVSAVELCAELFPVIKVAARDFEDVGLMLAIRDTDKPVIASVGNSDYPFAHIWTSLMPNQVALMHTVPLYPTPPDKANLIKMKQLQQSFPSTPVGYSNHVIGPDFCYKAVAYGAPIIEVHFTDDKTREFRDHQMSFDALDLKLFVKNATTIRDCLK